MPNRPLILFALCVALGSAPVGLAEDKAAPDPRLELFSLGPANTAVLITESNLAKIKLPAPLKISDALTITHVGAGVFEKEAKTGSMLFRPGDEVPLKTGLGFGWVMKVDSTENSVQVVEKFTLPKPNGKWSVDPDTTSVSDDGLTATTTEDHGFWDFIWRVWTLEEGDPDGPHSFTLKIAGKVVAELKFKIVKK